MHQCLNVIICNFAIFGPIFMKFSPICRAKELGMLFTIWKVFALFLVWEGTYIRLQNRPRKIPLNCTNGSTKLNKGVIRALDEQCL